MRIPDDGGYRPNRGRRRTIGLLGARPQTPGVYRIGPRARKDEKSVHPRTNGRPCSRPSWALGSHSCVALSSHEASTDYPSRRPSATGPMNPQQRDRLGKKKVQSLAAGSDFALDWEMPFMDRGGPAWPPSLGATTQGCPYDANSAPVQWAGVLRKAPTPGVWQTTRVGGRVQARPLSPTESRRLRADR